MLTGEAATEVECASARKKIGRLTGELVNWSVGQQVDRWVFKVNRFTCARSYGQQVRQLVASRLTSRQKKRLLVSTIWPLKGTCELQSDSF